MAKVSFITGITGQDGSYLSELLLSKDYVVYGIVRRTSLMFTHTRIDHMKDKINLKYGDLTDYSSISNMIQSIVQKHKDLQVLEIYNLGAQSHVGISFEIPEYTSNVDGNAVLNILQIIKGLDENVQKKVKFYQAGTSELYGKVLNNIQNEDTPFNPVSPYAAAKLYGYYLTKIYRDAYNLFCVNGVLFNHESPRRGTNFVTMKIVNAVKSIKNNTQECVELGNLYSKRDWGHAKDYVNGMWLMMQQDTPQDYVLATGKTYTVKKLVERCFNYVGMELHWEGENENEVGIDKNNIVRVKVNPKYYRPNEVELLLGDSTKAQTQLNWKCEYDLDLLIQDMMETDCCQ